MSISSEHSVVYLMGNGTAQRFDFDFRIFAKGDLSVYVDGALQTLDSDYEVKSDTLLPDGITYDWSSGGYVYFDPGSIPADGSVITISRKLAFTQHLDLQPGGEIPPENVERALDKLTMISQELKDELERTILHPMTIQYSIDGETGWTNEPTSDAFIYFRVSTDGGLTWSKPLLFGAELMNFLIGDQIVDGVTDKAPSQNAVYDALALKTDKATLTTKGDLYIRDATGVTRLPVGSDGEIPIADSAQTSGILWTPGRKQLTSAVTVTVGTGGDFATINAALNYLVKTYYPIYLSTGTVPQATIRLLTGFVMAEQVLVEGMDLGWITITGDDAETTIQRSALTKSFDVGYPAFCVIRGTLPTIGQLFSMDTSGVADNRHGIAAVINGRVTILPGYGVKNAASRGITAEHGSIITAYSAIATGAERGIYSLIGSIINADAADTSGATLYGISLYSGSIVNARGATGTLSQTANTITSNGIIFQ